MATAVIDWLFQASGVSNADGTHPAIVQGINEVAGPGNTALGARPKAMRFGSGVSCQATLSPGDLSATRFAIRVSFRVTSQVTTRGNLVECTALPFALFVQPGSAPDRFNIEASVHNGAAGWSGAGTQNRRALLLNQWYVASIVYDLDTLAVMVEDTVLAVAAFPRGGLHAPSGDQLHVGAWVNGVRWPFPGEIAGVQVWRDIPEALEAKLDAERGNAEWHLTRKEQDMRPTLNLGPRNGDFYYDPGTGAYIQSFSLAVISYTEAHGAAFIMYGAILGKWRTDENLRRSLGPLVSDEIAGRRAGSRKSPFAQGCIYWLPATGAVPVLGRMYLDYELIGEGSHAIGMPVAEVESISGGKVQRFQAGKMYLRNGGSNAFEVHGAILTKYEAAGGPGRFGFPISHESDVRRDTSNIGKVSEFERCTIYWSPSTPASIIYGAIRDRYRGAPSVAGEGGPLGDLGFPTSDESDIPGAAGARHNTFQNGSILWFNGPVFVCRPFTVSLGRLDTKEEDRDLFDVDGQNDLFCRVCVDVNGGRVFDRKYPESQTHYPSGNIRNLNLNVPYTVTPNSPSLSARVRVEVWESDSGQIFGGGNAHLGTMTKDLNMANAWGMRENNGLFACTNFGPWVNRLDWSVKPRVTASTPYDTFAVQNRGTTTVDWREYAAAFSDVDPDFELDFGLIDDGLKALYYEAVVKGVASGGNCFGMALENIYAWKEQSRLGRPLARFNNWGQVENDFNVKHAYQTGADAIWWIVGQFLSGNTHDPMGVFQASWDAFNRGENPVICIAQNYDFSGAPHCIMPISWNRNVTPWQMEVFDSNFPNQRRVVTVDPRNNCYRYDGSSDGSRIYTGDAWSGGRLQYIPWSVLNHRQRTPVWDAILLLLGGVVLLFADSTDVVSLTDEKGNSLDAASAKNRESLSGKLLGVHGLSGNGPVKGGFYVGRQDRKPLVLNPNVIREVGRVQSAALSSAVLSASATTLRASALRSALSVQPLPKSVVASDAPANAMAGAALMALSRTQGVPFMRPNQPTDLDTIRCALKGRANGKLSNYYKRGLLGLHVHGDVVTGEKVGVDFDRMSGRENEVRLQSDRARQYTVDMTHKLGAGKDFVKLTIQGVAADSGKPTRMNVQPGTRVIDVLSGGAANVQVVVDGVVGGNKVKSTFQTQLQGGQRLILPDLADPSHLKVGAIDTLMGSGRNFKVINKQ
jgi:LGFP repeat